MINSYKIYFNDSSISSLEDRLVTNYFCNVYGDGKICLGRSAQGIQDKLQNNQITDFATLHSYMFNEYFSGGWNTDLGSNLYSLMRSIDSSYMIKDYINLSDSSIDARAKKLKLKFFKSHHPAYEIANSFYNLSLLSLEETLNMVTEVKQKHFHQVKPISSIAATDVDSSVDHYVDPINFTDNYSNNYCVVKLVLDNSLNATNLNSRDIPSEILQFFKENSYDIMDQVYESYNSRNSMSIELNYQIPLISPSTIEEQVNV
jgi:TM2 domain-containing membrane protein YozV